MFMAAIDHFESSYFKGMRGMIYTPSRSIQNCLNHSIWQFKIGKSTSNEIFPFKTVVDKIFLFLGFWRIFRLRDHPATLLVVFNAFQLIILRLFTIEYQIIDERKKRRKCDNSFVHYYNFIHEAPSWMKFKIFMCAEALFRFISSYSKPSHKPFFNFSCNLSYI